MQAAICDYLAARRVFFFRCNNQPIFDPKRGIFRKLPKHTPKGIADIVVVKNGKVIFIEVKSDKGTLSPEQHEFGRSAIIAGADYVVAKSIDEVHCVERGALALQHRPLPPSTADPKMIRRRATQP